MPSLPIAMVRVTPPRLPEALRIGTEDRQQNSVSETAPPVLFPPWHPHSALGVLPVSRVQCQGQLHPTLFWNMVGFKDSTYHWFY